MAAVITTHLIPEWQRQDFRQHNLPCPLLDQRYSILKQTVIGDKDKQAVTESYDRLLKALENETNRIAHTGPKAVPEIPFSAIEANNGQLPDEIVEYVRQTGCLIIRNVVDEAQATKWEEDLRAYTKRHPKVAGYPKHDPQNFSLFWTPAQVQIRSHEKVLKAMHAVSRLWHVSRDDIPFDLDSQVAYADRFRIRHPSKSEFLKFHSCSFCHVANGSCR